jgi:hypothetical protein
MEKALTSVLGLSAAEFEMAWQDHWQSSMLKIQTELDELLAVRADAIRAGDSDAFLSTVDPRVPYLWSEQKSWMAQLDEHPVEEISLEGQPLALLEDGLLASVTLDYRLKESGEPAKLSPQWREATETLTILFTPDASGYRWAGVPFGVLRGEHVDLLYPRWTERETGSHLQTATALLAEAESAYAQLVNHPIVRDLRSSTGDVQQSKALTIKLYGQGPEFRTSIGLSYPLHDREGAWTDYGASVKVRLHNSADADQVHSMLAEQLARQLLMRAGVESEWLLRGMSLILAEGVDGRGYRQESAGAMTDLLEAVADGNVYALDKMPGAHEFDLTDDFRISNAQCQDTVRYLERSHGSDALGKLLRQSRTVDLDAAMRRSTGLGLSEFEQAWAESLARGHVQPAWIEVAQSFDPQAAYRHVEFLSSPRFAGRQAGSPEAEAAALHIAERFREYGLVPVGREMSADAQSFLQRFPISYTTYLASPSLDVLDQRGNEIERLVYRRDFVVPGGGAGEATDRLFWIRDSAPLEMELDGEIALETPSGALEAQVARADRRGAQALILMGKSASLRAAMSKQPFSPSLSLSGTMPVLELTRQGAKRLLEATGQTQQSLTQSPPALYLGLQVRLAVPLSEPATVKTANVAGLLPGSDPDLSRHVVVVGAHYDHVGDDPGSFRYAGANDDASGVGVLLEIARLWQESGYRPAHSVLFCAWGAQELGELGSRYYVEHPLLPLDQTMAVIQLDAVGGGRGYFVEAQGDPEKEGLLRFTMQVAEEWVDGRLTLTRPTGRSDHTPFREAGIPGLLVTWREASDENLPVEFADPVEPYRLGATGQMVALALMALAG